MKDTNYSRKNLDWLKEQKLEYQACLQQAGKFVPRLHRDNENSSK